MEREMDNQKELTYDEAYSRLQAIAAEVNGGGLGVDSINRLMDEAEVLVARCREQLYGLEKRLASTAAAWQQIGVENAEESHE